MKLYSKWFKIFVKQRMPGMVSMNRQNQKPDIYAIVLWVFFDYNELLTKFFTKYRHPGVNLKCQVMIEFWNRLCDWSLLNFWSCSQNIIIKFISPWYSGSFTFFDPLEVVGVKNELRLSPSMNPCLRSWHVYFKGSEFWTIKFADTST